VCRGGAGSEEKHLWGWQANLFINCVRRCEEHGVLADIKTNSAVAKIVLGVISWVLNVFIPYATVFGSHLGGCKNEPENRGGIGKKKGD